MPAFLTHHRNPKGLMTLFLSVLSISVSAQSSSAFLSAQERDSVKMGWMQGFPPPADEIISAADGTFFNFPQSRWSLVHMRELMPTVAVSRGLSAPVPLPYALDDKLDQLEFLPKGQNQTMTWAASLWKNYTDGIIILHRGKVVYERYFGALQPDRVHAVMSLTKSFTGTLAAVLVAEGLLDEHKPVRDYLPELTQSAFGDATVRQVMDMTTGLQYSEDYADPNAEVWQFSAAGNPLPKPKDYTGPVGYYAYLETVKKEGSHGEAFGYKTVNADALGWIIARATGKSLQELLSEKIWSQVGMEQDAYYQVDALGTPFAGGGFNAGLRDLARFGEMMRLKGKWQGRQIIPATAIADIEQGGSREAFAKSGHPELPGWSYRNMWWITENEHRAFRHAGCTGRPFTLIPKRKWCWCAWPRTPSLLTVPTTLIRCRPTRR